MKVSEWHVVRTMDKYQLMIAVERKDPKLKLLWASQSNSSMSKYLSWLNSRGPRMPSPGYRLRQGPVSV